MRKVLVVVVVASLVAVVSGTEASPTSLPAIDARCAHDADCGVSFLLLDGPMQCCVGCGQSTAGNKAWVSKLEAACKQVIASEHRSCPALACPSGPTRATCDRGTCKLVTP